MKDSPALGKMLFQYRLVDMQLILRLIKGNALLALQDLFGYFLATMGGQTMQDNGILFRPVKKNLIDLIRPENPEAEFVFILLSHAGPDIGVDHVSISGRLAGFAEQRYRFCGLTPGSMENRFIGFIPSRPAA